MCDAKLAELSRGGGGEQKKYEKKTNWA